MKEPEIVANGFRLATRRPSLLAWLFAVNFTLGALASVAPRTMFAPVLDHSLHSQQFVGEFSLGAFLELTSRPDIAMRSLLAQSYVFALIYLAFTLFVAGGITTVYLEDRSLTRPEFFESSGRYFFRMLRLALLALVPFGILAAAGGVVFAVSTAVGDSSLNPRLSFLGMIGLLVPMLLVGLLVRAWFDMAQADIVDHDERSAIAAALGALPITLRRAWSLVWAYVQIKISVGLLCAAVLWVWIRLPHAAIWRSFLLLEFMLSISLLMRLWQRATAITCYQRYSPIPDIAQPVILPAPHPAPTAANEPPEPTSGDTPSSTGSAP